jgi:hypothetical protein
VNRYLSPWARGVAAALVVLMGLTFAAPPAAVAATPQGPSKTPLAAAVDAKVAASSSQAVVAAPAQDAAGGGGGESKPFFKTGKGIAALVLMAGATGWLIASRKSSDVVHSPGRN